MKTLQKFQINRENALLVIVDMENEFCKPGGKLYTETSARIMPGVISAVSRLAEQARESSVPVIYIQGVRTLREPEFTVFGVTPHIKLGTWSADIIKELQPQKEDIVIQKFCHDPFYKRDLDRALKNLVRDPTSCCALVTGGAINVCAYHAVMGFHLRNYWTVVPIDAVYYIHDAGNQRALEQFSEEAYPNVFLSRSDIIEFSRVPARKRPEPVPAELIV